MDRTLLPAAITTTLVFLLFEFTGLDLWIQDHFYNFTTNEWLVDASSKLPKLLFYTGPKLFIWIIGLAIALAAATQPQWQKYIPQLCLQRCDMWVVVATLATAPALIALGKAQTNIFTPAQTIRYGGQQNYLKVLESYPHNQKPSARGRGFPAGHASGGFSLLSLAGLASSKRWRFLGIILGLTFGITMGGYQMLKGAHYLSHTLITAGLCWIVFLIWRRVCHYLK